MDFTELLQAVSRAFQQRDYAQFKALTDQFMSGAQGDDYCMALCLQVDWFMLNDLRHAAQGFVLVNEALQQASSPATRLNVLTSALGLCYMCSDVERARPYEEDACRLLWEHAGDPAVRARRHRLQLNLGQITSLRGDHATAYWHFAQAVNSLAGPDVSEAERQRVESPIQVSVAIACLRVRRYYEAQEALDMAEQSATKELHRLVAGVWRMELLRQLGRLGEAQQIVTAIEAGVRDCDDPGLRGRYYLHAALAAQDSGELPRFHQLLAVAHSEAMENHHDYLLSEIQRYQRSPL
ncbi:MAG TPA: hypothetical protein VD969_05880 [Symbiobacteriaceae bacterium]|nr:hypothetical protein [Symbiobacteriaceae bacterium]